MSNPSVRVGPTGENVTPVISQVPTTRPLTKDEKYFYAVVSGIFSTAISLVVEPIAGAFIGTYNVVNLASNLVLDEMGFEAQSTASKVVKHALCRILALGVGLTVVTGVFGGAILSSPTLVATVLAGVSIDLLTEFAGNLRKLKM